MATLSSGEVVHDSSSGLISRVLRGCFHLFPQTFFQGALAAKCPSDTGDASNDRRFRGNGGVARHGTCPICNNPYKCPFRLQADSHVTRQWGYLTGGSDIPATPAAYVQQYAASYTPSFAESGPSEGFFATSGASVQHTILPQTSNILHTWRLVGEMMQSCLVIDQISPFKTLDLVNLFQMPLQNLLSKRFASYPHTFQIFNFSP